MQSKTKFKPLFVAIGVALFLLIIIPAAVAAVFLMWPTQNCPGKDIIYIDESALRATYACDSAEQIKGLSNVSKETFKMHADAMVFVFNEERTQHFWMKDMQFDLDIVWVKSGEVVKIQENIPHTKERDKIARMSSVPHEVDVVLELEAGAVERFGIEVGDRVDWQK